MSGILKNLLFAIGLAAILWLGYTLFLAEDEETLRVENSAGSSEAARDAQEFLAVIQELQQIDFENTLFSDEKFRALIDYRQDVESEAAGRANPFDPVE